MSSLSLIRPLRWPLLLAAALLATGCASLLPRGSSQQTSPFETFEQAQVQAQRIVPFSTRTGELKDFGFDPASRNVTLIPYPEVISRLAPYQGVPLEALDPGIRRCLLAQADCKAYLYRFERSQRKREGSFWYDFFNVRRITRTTGWWFEALVVVDDGTVLFRNIAGQASTERVERQVNPLGPLQPSGEGAGALLLR